MERSCVAPWAFAFFVYWLRLSAAEIFIDFKVFQWAPCFKQTKEFLTLYGISVQLCVFECAVRSDCKYLGYKSRLHICHLHFKDDSESKESDGTSACMYIRREDIDVTEVGPVCACGDGQTCDISTGQCSFKECDHFALTDGKVFGNVRFVNAMVRVDCDDGFVETNGEVQGTCKSDGTWTYTPTCIIQQSVTTTTAVTETTVTANPDTVCPTGSEDWIHHSSDPDFEVMISQSSGKQSEASLACEALSAKLVKIDAEWKQIFLADSLANCADQKSNLKSADVFTSYSTSCYWIDGVKVGSTWQFADASPMPTDNTVFWDTGEPSDASGKTCVAINSNQRWITKNCNNACGHICQLPLS